MESIRFFVVVFFRGTHLGWWIMIRFSQMEEGYKTFLVEQIQEALDPSDSGHPQDPWDWYI